MAYTNTSATDLDDLIDKLYTFAVTTDGAWAGIYNEDLGQRQIGIEVSNCHIAIGSRSADVGIAKGSETDSILSAALSTALNVSNKQYWGPHAGSLVTTESSNDRIRCNDLGEPAFNNVWFFSGAGGDPDYIHMVVQTSAERYTHFSFGIIDSLGQSHPDVAFACGMYYEWWVTSGSNNNPGSGNHEVGYLGIGETSSNTYVPASVLAAGHPLIAGGVFNHNLITHSLTRGNTSAVHGSSGSAAGAMLDLFLSTQNQATTGGTALWGLPWLFRESSGSTAPSHMWLGILPGIRLVNMTNYTPGEEINQGGDIWTVFPWKRAGLRSELTEDIVNTIEFGFAYKKEV